MNQTVVRLSLMLSLLVAIAACSQATPQAPEDGNVMQDAESAEAVQSEGAEASQPITDDQSAAIADAEIGAEESGSVGSEAVDSGGGSDAVAVAGPGPTGIPGPITAISDTREYRDPSAGFAFDFPTTWSVAEYPGTMATITSYDPKDQAGSVMVAGDSKIDFTMNLAETAPNLDAMVAQVHADADIFDEEEWELAGGIPAHRLKLVGPIGDEMALVLTVFDGRGYRVHGYGDLTYFDPIARTLRPAQ